MQLRRRTTPMNATHALTKATITVLPITTAIPAHLTHVRVVYYYTATNAKPFHSSIPLLATLSTMLQLDQK